MSNVTVQVPQQTGTITITTAGATKREYNVTDGSISVPEGHLSDVLRLVTGATVKAADAPAAQDDPPAAAQLPKADNTDLATPAKPKR